MALTEVYSDIGLRDSNWIDKRDQRFKWCRENCKGYFTFDMFYASILWSFSDETEAMAFKLVWC